MFCCCIVCSVGCDFVRFLLLIVLFMCCWLLDGSACDCVVYTAMLSAVCLWV